MIKHGKIALLLLCAIGLGYLASGLIGDFLDILKMMEKK